MIENSKLCANTPAQSLKTPCSVLQLAASLQESPAPPHPGGREPILAHYHTSSCVWSPVGRAVTCLGTCHCCASPCLGRGQSPGTVSYSSSWGAQACSWQGHGGLPLLSLIDMDRLGVLLSQGDGRARNGIRWQEQKKPPLHSLPPSHSWYPQWHKSIAGRHYSKTISQLRS